MACLLMHRFPCSPLLAIFHGNRRAQTLVEYALILAVVSILALSVFGALGNRVVLLFSTITSLLDTAQAP